MAEITVRYVGPGYAILGEKAIYTGQTRTVPEGVLAAARRAHPKGFKVLGGEKESVSAETAAAQIPDRLVSDAARKLAEGHGIDLDDVIGTGAGGGVIKPDVERAIERQAADRLALDETNEADLPAELADVDQPE